MPPGTGAITRRRDTGQAVGEREQKRQKTSDVASDAQPTKSTDDAQPTKSTDTISDSDTAGSTTGPILKPPSAESDPVTTKEPTTTAKGTNPSSSEETEASDHGIITTKTRDYFEPVLCDRLNKLNLIYSVKSSYATLKTVDIDKLYWVSSTSARQDESKLLHFEGNPLVLYAVAELGFVKLRYRGDPVRHPTVLFKPLLQSDFEKADAILKRKSFPRKVTDQDKDGFWASCWMGSMSDPDYKVPKFKRVYDALADFNTIRGRMEPYPVSDLSKGDIVMLEMFVSRWVPKADDDSDAGGEDSDSSTDKKHKSGKGKGKGKGKDKQYKKKGKQQWRKWNVEFQLESIAVLYPGSDEEPKDRTEGEEFTG